MVTILQFFLKLFFLGSSIFLLGEKGNKIQDILGVSLRAGLFVAIFFSDKNLKKGFPLQSLTQIDLRFLSR
jgi:hypothetical protein